VHALYLLSVWLHILSAVVWIGGMVFLALVLVPVIRRPENRAIAASLIHSTGVRFRWVGWACLGLLIFTGTFNLVYRGFDWVDLWSGRILQGPFGLVLGIKLLLVAAILVFSVLHDFIIGPRATASWQVNPTSPEAMRRRHAAAWIGRINLFSGLVVFALGVMLVRGLP
jgi:uncharacterized membrane protein